MALDSSFIAQGVRPPGLDDPLTDLQQVQQIAQYRQQQALGPLRAQQLQNEVARSSQEVQQGQNDLNDQTTFQQAFHDPANADDKGNPDYDKIRKAVAPSVQLKNLQAFDADHLKLQQAATGLATSKIQNDRDKFLNIKNQNQMVGEHLAAVIQAPPDQKQQMYSDSLDFLQNKAGIDVSGLPKVYPGDDAAKAQAAKVGYLSTIITNADRQAQDEERRAIASKARVDAARKATQDMHSDAANDFLGIDNKADYDAKVKEWMGSDDAEKSAYAKRYLQALPYSDNAVNTIQRRALTAEQRAQQDQKTSTEAIAQQRADAADRRIDALIAASVTGKKATPGQFATVVKAKNVALAASQKQFEKDLQAAAPGGNVVDPDGFRTAYENHFERQQAAQRGYEEQTSALTGTDVGHNPWADAQTIPEPPLPRGKQPAPSGPGITDKIRAAFTPAPKPAATAQTAQPQTPAAAASPTATPPPPQMANPVLIEVPDGKGGWTRGWVPKENADKAVQRGARAVTQ